MSPIIPRIGTVFVPVRDVEAARDWYCGLLGVPADGEILFGHLYVLPVEGAGLALDSRIYSPEVVFSPSPEDARSVLDRCSDTVQDGRTVAPLLPVQRDVHEGLGG
jgi:catechol 2,3-dioxygenase-like lactoylglutathione lyase family enzyme